MLVGAPEYRSSSPGAECERCEFTHESVTIGVLLQQAVDGVGLDVVGVFAVDDDRVPNLARFDHVRCEVHAADKAEARVSDVEVDGRTGQAEAVVQAHRYRGLEVLSANRGVDQEAHFRGIHSGFG